MNICITCCWPLRFDGCWFGLLGLLVFRLVHVLGGDFCKRERLHWVQQQRVHHSRHVLEGRCRRLWIAVDTKGNTNLLRELLCQRGRQTTDPHRFDLSLLGFDKWVLEAYHYEWHTWCLVQIVVLADFISHVIWRFVNLLGKVNLAKSEQHVIDFSMISWSSYIIHHAFIIIDSTI